MIEIEVTAEEHAEGVHYLLAGERLLAATHPGREPRVAQQMVTGMLLIAVSAGAGTGWTGPTKSPAAADGVGPQRLQSADKSEGTR